MLISEAKVFAGMVVDLVYRDRRGDEIASRAHIYEVGFVALYGPCLVTDIGEIRIDRVVSVTPLAVQQAA